jgi:hypothetical protein
MKAKENQSNTATTARVHAIGISAVEFQSKKFWLPLMLGACLFYLSDPAHAVEQQGTGSQPLQSGDSSGQAGNAGGPSPTQRQGAGRGTKPPTDYTGTQSNPGSDQGSDEMNRRTDPRSEKDINPDMNKGTSPGSQPPPDTTLDTEEMNRGSAPNTENINKDTVGPGGDNMMRDAIPGGSGMNR